MLKQKTMSLPATLKSPVKADLLAIEEEISQPTRLTEGWGWLPALSLVMAVCLLAVTFSFNLGREQVAWAITLFWVGLVGLFGAAVVRMLSSTATNRERLALVTLLGLGLYMVKVLNSPLAFTFHDEFIHWRTANDILQTGHLFSINPVIPVSPLYPGLQLITTALDNLGGLPVFESGILVLAVARLVLIGSLFWLYSEISKSPRVAGLACLFYMANPNFLYFSSQYAYESLALPLAVLVLYAEATRQQNDRLNRFILNVVIVLGLIGLVVTHHLTAFAMVGFLGLWIAVAFLRINFPKIRRLGRGVTHRLGRNTPGSGTTLAQTEEITWPGTAFLLTFVTSVAWLVYVATFTVGYLAPVLQGAVLEIIHLIEGEAGGRRLFQGSTGQLAPLWEQLTGFGAVGLIMFMLPFGLWQVWKHQRYNTLALTLAVGAIAYPVTLALRFTVAGWEISNRTSEFVFVPLAYVLAFGLVHFWLRLRPAITWRGAAGVVMCTVFLGGVLVGTTPYVRIPGPYLVEADSRSIQEESIAAAQWFLAELGPGNRTATDRDNNLLLISYGQQHGVMNVGDKVNVGPLFLNPTIGELELNVLKQGKIRYVMVDKRISTGLPLVGIYFEAGEPDSNNHKTPIDPAALAKFEKLPAVKRIFDSGNIVVYDVGAISGVS